MRYIQDPPREWVPLYRVSGFANLKRLMVFLAQMTQSEIKRASEGNEA